jgi:outer membrane protein OmpA-like peptidoglycan-associated protein
MNIKTIADYLKQYPEAKASVMGYADKGTGNAKINEQLAEKRANVVAEQLKTKYGISADRLTVGSKGDTEQPFSTNDWNRVVIMIAE